jgi:DNA-binding MarR family transcriptional regulator
MSDLPNEDWPLSSFAGPQESPGFVLWKQFMVWQRNLNAKLKPLGLTQPQFAILAVCGWMTRDGSTTTQQDIASFLGVDKMHVSQIAARLGRDGLIERSLSDADQRSKSIRLTQLGLERLVVAIRVVEEYDRKFFAAAGLPGPSQETRVSGENE